MSELVSADDAWSLLYFVGRTRTRRTARCHGTCKQPDGNLCESRASADDVVTPKLTTCIRILSLT